MKITHFSEDLIMTTNKTFQGIDIKEVWDYRLSSATPMIDRRGGTWVVHIYAKANADYDPANPESIAQPLESFDTEIPAEKGDTWDVEKVKVCYEWLYSVRDKYSLPNIEQMKPHVAKINAANKALADLAVGKSPDQFYRGAK